MKFKRSKIQKLLVCIGSILITNACNSKSLEAESSENSNGPENSVLAGLTERNSLYDLIYAGILPCKDCGGIKTTLELSTKTNKFKLKEEFLKTEITPNVLLGSFNTERGFEKDEDATLYVLNDELPETEHLYFLRETGRDTILLKLDNTRQKTDHVNFKLKKISE